MIFERISLSVRVSFSLLALLLQVFALVGCDKKQDVRVLNAALLTAATQGDNDMLKKLLHDGADPNIQDSDGCTPLYGAIRNGYASTAEILLNSGADANVKCGNRSLEDTALMLAARKGHFGIVKLLVDHGARVNERNNKGNTALLEAVYAGRSDIVGFLLENRADIRTTYDKERNPLIAAVCRKNVNINIVKMLLERGANPNVKTDYGNTALKCSKLNNDTQVIELLRAAGAHDE